MNNEKKFWNEAIETLPPDELNALQWKRLKAQLQYNYDNSEFYRYLFTSHPHTDLLLVFGLVLIY